MNIRTCLIIFLLVILLSVITDSLPEAIGGLIAGIIAIVFAVIWMKWHIARGFNARFSLDPLRFKFRQMARQHTKVWECKPGEHELLLRVMPNAGTNFGRIGIRFVSKKTFKWPWPKGIEIKSRFDRIKPHFSTWEAEKSGIVEIIETRDLEVDQIRGMAFQDFHCWDDGIYGVWGQYIPTYHRSVDDSLWLQVKFRVNGEWQGCLQFIGHVSDAHRGYNRLQVKFTETPNHDRSNFHCIVPSVVYPEISMDSLDY